METVFDLQRQLQGLWKTLKEKRSELERIQRELSNLERTVEEKTTDVIERLATLQKHKLQEKFRPVEWLVCEVGTRGEHLSILRERLYFERPDLQTDISRFIYKGNRGNVKVNSKGFCTLTKKGWRKLNEVTTRTQLLTGYPESD